MHVARAQGRSEARRPRLLAHSLTRSLASVGRVVSCLFVCGWGWLTGGAIYECCSS